MFSKTIIFANLLTLLFPWPIFNQHVYQVFRDSFNDNSRIEIKLNQVNDNYDIPESSSQVFNLPWINDEDFLRAKNESNTPILMAAFCTVLINPLPGEEYNVALAAKKICGQVVKPSEIFSQNARLGPYNEKNGYREGATYVSGEILMDTGGGVCKIATSLYNLVVLTNQEVIERHNHSMPINYVPYGQDATVAYGVKDFKFKNNTQGNILIWSKLIDNRLYMGFYGTEKPPEITWKHYMSNAIKPPIKYVKNEDLNQGEMRTVVQGLDGATVKSEIIIKYRDNTTEIRDMGISRYMPLPELIEIN